MDGGGSSRSWRTLGEEGAEVSGVEISSMSAYDMDSLEPFLLKALLKELRSCRERTRTAAHECFVGTPLVVRGSISHVVSW